MGGLVTALTPDDPRHGTRSTYNNHKCRCDRCRAANAAEMIRQRAARATRPVPGHVHGTRNGYVNYNCRCKPCTDAQSDYCRSYASRVA